MSSASDVAEIFICAGNAFSKLGELTMNLHKDDSKSSATGKWTVEEVQLLKKAVSKFGTDIEQISNVIKTRSSRQIKEAIKRRNLISQSISESQAPKSDAANNNVNTSQLTEKSN